MNCSLIIGAYNWPEESGFFQASPDYILTSKEKKNRLMIKFENLFDIELSKKHFKLI